MPFIRTALISDEQSDDILHYGAIKLRVNGSGSLDAKFLGLDDTTNQSLIAITMSNIPGKEPLRLSNFNGQKVRLELSTNEIDEIMRVNKIIVYVKQLYTEYAS